MGGLAFFRCGSSFDRYSCNFNCLALSKREPQRNPFLHMLPMDVDHNGKS